MEEHTEKIMTTFHIVRHGETDWNAQKLVQGHTDIPLNAMGEEQAKALAQELRSIKFDLAFSSDLLRAKRTAEIIALEHDLIVEAKETLRERNFGSLEGKSHDIFQTYDALYDALSEEKRVDFAYDGSVESDNALISRLLTFIRETALAHPGKNILIASHGGIIRTLLIHLGFVGYDKHVRVSNAADLVIETDGVEFFIKETNGITLRDRE